MEIEIRATKELKAFDQNARTHSNDQIVEIMNSIKIYGFLDPIEITADDVVISGHARLLAAKKLKMKTVPTITHSHLSDAERRAYTLAANRIQLSAEWDNDLVSSELAFLNAEGFDLALTGFSDDEIDAYLAVARVEETFGDEDDCEAVQADSVSVAGDVWVLGTHRVMCGDSTMIDDVDRLMEGSKADMVFTDPPYNMDFAGGLHGDGTKSYNAKHGKIINDRMNKKDAGEFFDAVNAIIRLYCTGAFYITFYRLGILEYWQSLERSALTVRSLVIWSKGNHTLSNSDYMSTYEPIFYGWVDDHKFNGGNNGRDIWDIKRTQKNDLHPTMKPVELIEKAVTDGSFAKGTVLDLFGGSGSTIIACEKLDRKCYMMELSPHYCDVIVKRWQTFTGKTAILEKTGVSFEEIKNGGGGSES